VCIFIAAVDEGYIEEPIGPISTLIPSRCHRYIDKTTLKSYVASSETDAQKFQKKVEPADIPIITKKSTSNNVYSHISENLTAPGQDAIKEISPRLFNLLIDWCPDFERFVCSNPIPGTCIVQVKWMLIFPDMRFK